MIEFFTDPVLRAPTLGTMLMGFAAGLVGALVFVRKRSLVGETLSHATYPGVTLAVIASALWGNAPALILCGAFLTALLGYQAILFLERRLKIREDSALCMVLASFFGFGITIASYVQFSHTHEYRSIQAYLYGQAATMTDSYLFVYSALCLLVLFSVLFFYKELQVLAFDNAYARTLGVRVKGVDLLMLALTVLAVVIGIRSVGVVLMSAMLIAPPTAARQYTNRLSTLLLLSALFGALSGWLGNILSFTLSQSLAATTPGWRASLPTGPVIVLVASGLAIFSLLFAPERGVLVRMGRIARFRFLRLQENVLKVIWHAESHFLPFSKLSQTQNFPAWYLRAVLLCMRMRGWIMQRDNHLSLTLLGKRKGGQIVRLHRLWELYLVDYLGVGAERVHKSAEEMEHILTPAIEKELTELLDNPKTDPHAQPIPCPEEVTAHG